jgi:hypothetical protein
MRSPPGRKPRQRWISAKSSQPHVRRGRTRTPNGSSGLSGGSASTMSSSSVHRDCAAYWSCTSRTTNDRARISLSRQGRADSSPDHSAQRGLHRGDPAGRRPSSPVRTTRRLTNPCRTYAYPPESLPSPASHRARHAQRPSAPRRAAYVSSTESNALSRSRSPTGMLWIEFLVGTPASGATSRIHRGLGRESAKTCNDGGLSGIA